MTVVVNGTKVGMSGLWPGSMGSRKAFPPLAAAKSVGLSTRARCPRSVLRDGMAMAFSLIFFWNF